MVVSNIRKDMFDKAYERGFKNGYKEGLLDGKHIMLNKIVTHIQKNFKKSEVTK